MDIYQFVRVLGFSAEYVETMTPNERELYKELYRREVKEKNKDELPMGMNIGSGIDTIE